jgi:2-polyprenyl-3-methyl-5-hydroxy-6-metoxy-1,4-benzoquinol methylase
MGHDLNLIYPSNFQCNNWKDAVPYFLTSRKKSVFGDTVQCNNCSFIFTNPQFTDEEYSLIYQNVEGRKALEKVSNIRYQKLRNYITKRKSCGTILDIGSGDGTFLSNLPQSFQFTGIEPGAHFQNNTFENGIIHSGNFSQISDDFKETWTNHFDIITAWDLIEHIPDINDFFSKVFLLLKNDGILFATLPNIESNIAKLCGNKWNLLLLEHLWYFSPSTLNLIAKKHGLRVVKHQHFSYSIDLRTFVLRICQTYAHRFSYLSNFVSNKIILNIPIGLMMVSITKE